MRKSQNKKIGKIWAFQAPTPQRREPTPRRSPMPQHGMPSPRRGRGSQKGTPRVLHSIALLRRSEGLLRNIAMLRRCVDTVHREEIFGFCSKSLVFVHR